MSKANPVGAIRIDSLRKTGSGLCGCVFGLLILLGAMYLILTVFNDGWDALLEAPWAHSLFGRPTLTGTWTGEFTSPSGIQFGLYLDIGRAHRASGRYYTERQVGAIIDGQAQWCDNGGRHAESIPIQGSVPAFTGFNGSADNIHVALDLASRPQLGLLPDEFEGSWHTNTLTLNPTFIFWDGKTFGTTSSNPDLTGPITIVLKKGNQNTFQALCEKLKDSNP